MSHADKRSVATDALETLGMIIGEGEARDAIHLAVEPVIASDKLYPAQDVGLLPDGTAAGEGCKMLGIVDPFLTKPVEKGERFWLVVYPRQIKSLRHVWEHPDFPSSLAPTQPDDELLLAEANAVDTNGLKVADSMRWIQEYAEGLGSEDDYYGGTHSVTAEELIDTAKSWVGGGWGNYLVKGGLLEGVSLDPEFWPHFEVVTGLKAPVENRESFFSCSC